MKRKKKIVLGGGKPPKKKMSTMTKGILFGSIAGLVLLTTVTVSVTVLVKQNKRKKVERLLEIGNLAAENGEYESAEESFLMAVNLDEDSVEASLGLAEAYAGEGKNEEALAAAQHAADLINSQNSGSLFTDLGSAPASAAKPTPAARKQEAVRPMQDGNRPGPAELAERIDKLIEELEEDPDPEKTGEQPVQEEEDSVQEKEDPIEEEDDILNQRAEINVCTIEDCRVFGLDDAVLTPEQDIELEVYPCVFDTAEFLDGDQRYVEKYWSFKEKPKKADRHKEWVVTYSAELDGLERADLYVFFQKEIYNNGSWEKEEVESLHYTIAVKGNTAETPEEEIKAEPSGESEEELNQASSEETKESETEAAEENREPRIVTVRDCTVSGLEDVLETDQEILFTVTGIGEENADPVEGDMKYVPVFWSFEETPTQDSAVFEWKITIPGEMAQETDPMVYIFAEEYVYSEQEWKDVQTEHFGVALKILQAESITEEETTDIGESDWGNTQEEIYFPNGAVVEEQTYLPDEIPAEEQNLAVQEPAYEAESGYEQETAAEEPAYIPEENAVHEEEYVPDEEYEEPESEVYEEPVQEVYTDPNEVVNAAYEGVNVGGFPSSAGSRDSIYADIVAKQKADLDMDGVNEILVVTMNGGSLGFTVYKVDETGSLTTVGSGSVSGSACTPGSGFVEKQECFMVNGSNIGLLDVVEQNGTVETHVKIFSAGSSVSEVCSVQDHSGDNAAGVQSSLSAYGMNGSWMSASGASLTGRLSACESGISDLCYVQITENGGGVSISN